MENKIKILILEDVYTDLELILLELKNAKIRFNHLHVENEEDFRKALVEYNPDLILSDYMLPQFTGMKALLIVKEISPNLPFIIVTGSMNEEIAVDCMKAGASDYIIKENLKRLGVAIIGSFKKQESAEAKIKAENDLYESEEFTKRIIDSSGDSIKVLDLKGNLLSMSEGGQTLLEIDDINQYLNKSWVDFWKGDDNKAAINAIANAKKGESALFSGFRPTEKGTPKWWEIIVSPIKNAQGKIYHLLAVSREITERKRAEEKIREQNEFLGNIIESLSHPFYVIDAHDYTIIMSNSASGINSDLKKAKCHSLDHHSDKPCQDTEHPCPLEMVKKSKKPVMVEHIHFDKNGKKINIEVHGHPILDNKGNVYQMIEYCFDITRRKQAENKTKEALIKAEENEKLKSAFLANMSHEIRTPMNAIIGFSNLLADAESEEKRNEFVNIINSNGEHLLGILTNIIDISKIEAGIIKIENEDCNINRIFDEVLGVYLIKDKLINKEIEISLIKGLDDNNANIIIDKIRINQILINLMENAYKFTSRGKIELGYSLIQDEDNNDFLEFFVRDSGVGIENSKQKMIFERFSQEDSSTTRLVEGTGIGLTITRAIVNVLDGDIWVESEPEKGSTFYFTIPYRKVDIGKRIIKTSPAEIINWSNKTILIAEDMNDSFNLIKIIFEKTHANIIRAVNGSEAIDICRKEKQIDLVLMDVRMPYKNGYEATEEIKKFRPDLPIIAQTAYAVTGDKKKAIGAGCDDYLTKPISPKLLIKKINVWFTEKK